MFFNNPTCNIDPETGMRYGVINANDAPHLFEEITLNGTNTTYQTYLKELDSQIEDFFVDKEDYLDDIKGFFSELNLDEDLCQRFAKAVAEIEGDLSEADTQHLRDILLEKTDVEFDQENYEYEKDGESYGITHLSGPLLWVFKSPVTALVDLCSPCVPNAGNLNSPNPEGVPCYAVPTEWFDDDDNPCPYTTQSVEEKELAPQ